MAGVVANGVVSGGGVAHYIGGNSGAAVSDLGLTHGSRALSKFDGV
jgi:hypothetical protein